ncbi:Alg9-like mannosyltransferase family-domain-containing protein [Peziza echinospora]|nr:Alg9-like mannosyltransferase family-domain-containing protein [Peziza echinospora]
MALSDNALALLIPTLVLAHLLLAPYSKVEESFNLQAIHDALRYGIPNPRSPYATQMLKAEYDHFTFPGAVPRTFVGAVILAGLSRPFLTLTNGIVNEQLVVRGVLGLFNAFALISYGRAARKAFGRGVGNWYILLQSSQFHILFYASRALPNMFAFGLTTYALQHFLPIPAQSTKTVTHSRRLGIYILTFTAIVFRSEVALLLFTNIAFLLLRGQISLFREIIPGGIAGGIVGLASTLSLDSYFWQSYSPLIEPPLFSTPWLTTKLGLIWPEFSAFYYNAVQGEASAWGTSPWHYYFTNSIPKLLMNPLILTVLLPLAVLQAPTRPRVLNIIAPLVGFVGLYSALPHKEWRFILYVIPQLTLVAAIGADWIWKRKEKSARYAILALALLVSIGVTFVASSGMLLISAQNYPGGVALERLHSHLGRAGNVTVHLDVPVCMTGATRFLQEDALYPTTETVANGIVKFDKTEKEGTLLQPKFWKGIDWVLSSRPPTLVPGDWETVDVVRGYKKVRIFRRGEDTGAKGYLGKLESLVRERLLKGLWVGVEKEDKVWILKKAHGERS